MAFLRLDRHGGDGTRFQATKRNGLARDFAISIFAIVDPPQGSINFRDELALAVARAQLDRPVGLARRAVVEIGFA